MSLRKIGPAAETTVVWLFLFQALRMLFASMFGVIYDAVFDHTLPYSVVAFDLLLVILAMLTPLFLHRVKGKMRPRLAAVLVVLSARVALASPSPTLRLYVSILLLGGAAFYVAHLLWHEPRRLVLGLLAGLVADQLFRALNYTYDPTLHPEGWPLVVALSIITAALSLYLARDDVPAPLDQPDVRAGLALGAGLFVELSLLTLPNAFTRWSGMSYNAAAPLLLLVTLLPLVPMAQAMELYVATLIWPMWGTLSIGISLLCMALAALLGGGAAGLLLLIAQPLFLFNLYASVVGKRRINSDGTRLPGVGVSLGLLLFLLFNFFFAFTFTYPYTLSVFRGLGTPLLLLGVLAAGLPAINPMREPEVAPLDRLSSALSAGGVLLLVTLCAWLTRPADLTKIQAAGPIRLATYNIHYGFDSEWVYSLREIAETIKAAEVDAIVLQEVDVARITSLSVDNALWLSQQLDMHAVYQPTLEKLSGIALLSRFPLATSDGQHLTSALEQTAIVHGAVTTQRGPLHVYGVWLGLEPEERATQLSEALDYVGSDNPAALGGDFNAAPNSPVYARLLEAGLQDPFSSLGIEGALTSPTQRPLERIDYVWLRGLTPLQAWVSDSNASDHRMVVVEVQYD